MPGIVIIKGVITNVGAATGPEVGAGVKTSVGGAAIIAPWGVATVNGTGSRGGVTIGAGAAGATATGAGVTTGAGTATGPEVGAGVKTSVGGVAMIVPWGVATVNRTGAGGGATTGAGATGATATGAGVMTGAGTATGGAATGIVGPVPNVDRVGELPTLITPTASGDGAGTEYVTAGTACSITGAGIGEGATGPILAS
jgi:hypothetical protein